MPSLKRNLAYNAVYQVVSILAPLVTAPYVARVLGPAGLGAYAYTQSIAEYFALAAMLGIANHGSRLIARASHSRNEKDAAFSSLYTLQLTVSTMALATYAVFIAFAPQEFRALLAIQGIWILAALFDVSWLLNGMENFRALAVRNTAVKLVTIASVFLLVRSQSDLWVYALILSASAVLGQLAMWPMARSLVSFRRPDFAAVRAQMRPSLILFLPLVAMALTRITGRVIVGSTSTESELGYFVSAERLIGIPVSIITAIGIVMYPRFARMIARNDVVGIERLTRSSVQLIWCVAFAITFGVVSVADRFTPLFFGSEFDGAVSAVIVLAVSVPFVAFTTVVRTQVLLPRSLDRQYVAALFCGTVVGMPAFLLLSPVLGALGGATALLLADSVVCLIQCLFARKYISMGECLRSGLPFVVIGTLMYFLVRAVSGFTGSGVGGVLISTVAGAVFYCAAVVVYLVLTRDPARLLSHTWLGRRTSVMSRR